MTSTQLSRARTPDTVPAPPAMGRAARRKQHSSRKRSLAARYLGYVGYFVGAGLISGAVVHHPIDPDRYTRIALYGALVFLAATVLNEFLLTRERPGLPRMLVVIGSSLLLSFGIGMLSGGLQHFGDFPARGAVLVPTGLVVSFIAYVAKDADTPWYRVFGLVGLTVAAVAALAFFGLREVAASMEGAPGGGHSHGTAEEPAAGHNSAPVPTATPAQGASATPEPASPTPAHDDGHAHQRLAFAPCPAGAAVTASCADQRLDGDRTIIRMLQKLDEQRAKSGGPGAPSPRVAGRARGGEK